MPTGSYLCLYQILSKYFKPQTQEFGLEIHSGEVTKTTIAEVVLIARDMPTGPYLCLYKIFQTIKKLQGAQEFSLDICSEEIIRKRTDQ